MYVYIYTYVYAAFRLNELTDWLLERRGCNFVIWNM